MKRANVAVASKVAEISACEALIGQAAGEFFEAIARGETPSVEEIAGRYPDIAEDIHRTFPALLVLGNIASDEELGQVTLRDRRDQTLGDFRIVRELGRGGMGVVYEAEQLSIGRRVALKVLPFAGMLDQQQRNRFKNEARAAGTLDHPNIVAVYAVGVERGVHYYAMQLVEGKSVAECIAEMRLDQPALAPCNSEVEPHARNTTPGDTTQAALSTFRMRDSVAFYIAAARLGIQAAEALHHAHRNGILHRDIKPANLLIDNAGKLWITDFGLARIEADAGITMTGDMIGTLRYMSPEQVSATPSVIDHRTDIYALGATLYELLSLSPVFDGEERGQLIQRIATNDPPRLRQRDSRIPVELDTIVGKAMEKDPADRYASAWDVAEDLHRFVNRQPLHARPASHVDRLVKWSRRNHKFVATIGLFCLLLSIVLAISAGLVNQERIQAIAAGAKTADLLYMADMTLAYQAWDNGKPADAQALLDRHHPHDDQPDRRGLEWRLLNAAINTPKPIRLAAHLGSVNEIAVLPDGRRLVSVGDDATLRIWDLPSRSLLQTIKLGNDPLYSVAVSPDGRYVAAGSKAIYVCDLLDGGQFRAIFHSDDNFESLAFHPGGLELAAGSRYHDVLVLSLDGEVMARADCGSRAQSLEFIPGTTDLLVPARNTSSDISHAEVARIWHNDLTSIRSDVSLDGGGLVVARPAPSGKLIIAGDRTGRAIIIERATGTIRESTPAYPHRLIDAAFAPDSRTFAAGYANGVVEVYKASRPSDAEIKLNDRMSAFQAHMGEVRSCRFIDQVTLVTCGEDGLIKIWRLKHFPLYAGEVGPQLLSISLSPDAALFACTHIRGLSMCSTRTAQRVWKGRVDTQSQGATAWSHSGKCVAIADESSDSRQILIFDRKGNRLRSLAHPGAANAIAFSRDDKTIAIIGEQVLCLRDAESGTEIASYELPSTGNAVAFSNDGTRLACAMESHPVVMFNLQDLVADFELKGSHDVSCLAFSQDDSLLATGNTDGALQLWETLSGSIESELTGHEDTVCDVALSPDNRTLLSSSRDGTVRLWSVPNAREYGVFFRKRSRTTTVPEHSICRMSLSVDGRFLVVGDANDNGRLDAHVLRVPEFVQLSATSQ